MRILILEETVESLEKKDTMEDLVLGEYYQFLDNQNHKIVSSTQKKYPMHELVTALGYIRYHLLLAGQYQQNRITDTDIYQLAFQNKHGIVSGDLGVIEQLAVVIPGDLKEKYREDDRLFTLRRRLEELAEIANKRVIRKKLKLQKYNKYKGTIALVLATAATIGMSAAAFSKAMEYKEAQERKRFESYFQPYEPLTIEQLQQMEKESQWDSWDYRLQEQVEENKRTRKYP